MNVEVFGDDSGTVDWWFIYKLPHGIEPLGKGQSKYKKTTGSEYLYMDAKSSAPLSMSKHTLEQEQGAMYNTLKQLYAADSPGTSSLGWICYNDEIPGVNENDERKGHSKGVLAFDLDSDSAFWLLHSWPKFLDVKTGKPAAWTYGQTFLCIALKDVETARSIAEQMYHRQEPQTYQVRLPKNVGQNDILYRLATDVDVNETDPPCDITFFSKGGYDFRLMAKNRHWDKDFWIDLVGPHLKVDIDVETWRRGTLPDTEDSDAHSKVTDILYINLESLDIPFEWHYTKDHAKWGVSESDDWVCVADINRQTSQEKRGGGSICFRDKLLWESLRDLEQLKK